MNSLNRYSSLESGKGKQESNLAQERCYWREDSLSVS